MKNFLDIWRISKYGNSRFKDKERSPFIDLLEAKETSIAIDIASFALDIALMSFYGYSFFAATIVSACFHLLCTSSLAVTSTILERAWRKKLDSRKAFSKTLDRFGLNKERRAKNGR